MKKFQIVLKDILTEETRTVGYVNAENKEQIIKRNSLKKGENIKYLEYYWHPVMGEVLIFIHEVVEIPISDEEKLKEAIWEFHRYCY